MKMINKILEIESKLHIDKPSFNVLIDGNATRREILHSEIISALLDTRRDEGERLCAFLKYINVNADDNFKQWDVRREYNKIDILIENGITAIIIENKIDAIDKDRQLERYYNKIKKEGYKKDKIHIVYITPFGDCPSSNSLGVIPLSEVITLSYKKDITSWLDKCISIADAITKKNIEIYKETINNMVAEEKKARDAIKLVFEKGGVSFEKINLIKKAGLRYCHYSFLKELARLFIKDNYIVRSVKLNNVIENDEYGIFVEYPNFPNMLYGILFSRDNPGNEANLYVGLYAKKRNKDESLYELINKSKYRKWHREKIPNPWYFWQWTNKVQTIGLSYNDKITTDVEKEEWTKWANEGYQFFKQTYKDIGIFLNINIKL